MNQNQSFSFNADFLNSYPHYFINLIVLLVVIYTLFVVIDFFREKYSLKEKSPDKDHFLFLIITMSKLFPFAAAGFIIANILQVILAQIQHSFQMPGEWSNLSFGIILLFVGMGLKALANNIKKVD